MGAYGPLLKLHRGNDCFSYSFDWGVRNITFVNYFMERYDYAYWGTWFGMFFKMFFTVFAAYNTTKTCIAEILENKNIMKAWKDEEADWESWQATDIDVEIEEGEEEEEGSKYNVGAMIGNICVLAVYSFSIYNTWTSEYQYYGMGYTIGKLATTLIDIF